MKKFICPLLLTGLFFLLILLSVPSGCVYGSATDWLSQHAALAENDSGRLSGTEDAAARFSCSGRREQRLSVFLLRVSAAGYSPGLPASGRAHVSDRDSLFACRIPGRRAFVLPVAAPGTAFETNAFLGSLLFLDRFLLFSYPRGRSCS